MTNQLPEADANLNKSLAQVWGLLRRRRWWILLPSAATIFATLFVLSLMPNRYTSEATLLVIQQQIPQRYVLPTTTTSLRDTLRATTEEVLSRMRLLAIIDEFGLYANQRKSTSPESLIDLMRHDIEIKPIEDQPSERDINSFNISFVARIRSWLKRSPAD